MSLGESGKIDTPEQQNEQFVKICHHLRDRLESLEMKTGDDVMTGVAQLTAFSKKSGYRDFVGLNRAAHSRLLALSTEQPRNDRSFPLSLCIIR